jgi:hypothetical protein
MKTEDKPKDTGETPRKQVDGPALFLYPSTTSTEAYLAEPTFSRDDKD